MSYRTYVNDKQLFGNNESYGKWMDFIAKQGIEINEEGDYEGHITNFMGALEVLEEIALDIQKEREERIAEIKKSTRRDDPETQEKMLSRVRSLYDLSYIPSNITEDKYVRNGLFDELYELVNNGYLFLPMAFYLACKDQLQPAKQHINKRWRSYELKPGQSIHVKAG